MQPSRASSEICTARWHGKSDATLRLTLGRLPPSAIRAIFGSTGATSRTASAYCAMAWWMSLYCLGRGILAPGDAAGDDPHRRIPDGAEDEPRSDQDGDRNDAARDNPGGSREIPSHR